MTHNTDNDSKETLFQQLRLTWDLIAVIFVCSTFAFSLWLLGLVKESSKHIMSSILQDIIVLNTPKYANILRL